LIYLGILNISEKIDRYKYLNINILDFVKLRMLGRGLLGFLSLLRLILPNPLVDTPAIPVTEPSTQPDPTSRNADVSCEVVCSTNGPNVFTFKSAIPLLLYDFQSLSRQLAAVFPHYCYHRFQSLVVAYPANTLINVLNRMTVLRNSFTAHLAIKLSSLPGNGLSRSNNRRIIASAIISRISRPVPPSSKRICDFPEHEDDTFKVVFSPSGAICAITSWGTVKICKVENGRFVCLHALKHRERAIDIKFHPTLPYFVVCADTATIYRIMEDGTFKVIATIEAKRFESATVRIPHGDFFSASFHPTDRLIALGCDNWCIYLYIFTDEGCTRVQRLDRTTDSRMTGHFNVVATIEFDRSGNFFVSGSDDQTVKVWEKEENGLWVCARTIEDHDGYIRAVALDSTGQFLVTTSCDKTIRIYKTGTWECLQTIITDTTKGISSCMFYPSDQVSIFATGSYDGKTTFFRLSDDGTTSEVLETLTHPSGVYSLSFDQSTRSLVVGLCMNYLNRHKSTVELYQLPK
jgi:WD40 repeat protein